MDPERLSSMDISFLDVETSGPSVAVGSVMRVKGDAATLPALQEFFAGRIQDMPRFRQKVVWSRAKIRRAKWVEVEPDLNYHVRQVTLSRGGSIDPVVSEILEIPLDRDQPLWDCTLVTGYSESEWTIITRLHHSIADGQGAVILLGNLIDMAPGGSPKLSDAIQAMSEPEVDTEIPIEGNNLEAVAARAVAVIESGFEGVGQFISTYPDTVRTLLNLLPQRPTELAGRVSGKRKWVGGNFSLLDIKQARKAFKGVTINDMVLASVAYGFTQLLDARGDDPTGRTLRAVMPVSLRTNMKANNQVGILPAPLPLGEMEPAARMKAIHRQTKIAKRSKLPIIIEGVRQATENLTPAPLQQFVLARSGGTAAYVSDTLVTNVPGPQIPLFFMGQEIIGAIPVIPIEGSMRIIVGITSFQTDLNVGITGDGEYAADVDVLLRGILAGFQELCDVAAARKLARG